jgi:hypothetical protein
MQFSFIMRFHQILTLLDFVQMLQSIRIKTQFSSKKELQTEFTKLSLKLTSQVTDSQNYDSVLGALSNNDYLFNNNKGKPFSHKPLLNQRIKFKKTKLHVQ